MDRLKRAALSLPAMAAAVLLIMAAVLGAGIMVSLRTSSSIESLRTQAGDADRVGDICHELLVGLLDAESNARAFMMTRRADLMVPYTTARISATASMAQLDQETQRLPSLAADTQAILALATRRLDLLATGIRTADAGSEEALQAIYASQAGSTTMKRTRALIEQVSQHAAAERDHRAADQRRREQAVFLAVLVSGVAAVLLLGTASLALLVGRDRLLRAQRALGVQAAQWQATVENLQDGVAVFDAAGSLVQWNRSLAPLTAFPSTLLRQGAPFGRFAEAAADWEPPVLAKSDLATAGLTDPAQPVAVQPVVEVRAGERVLEVWRNAMPGGGQMLTVGDVTRRVAAEAIARQAQKMEVLGQLTGGVAHDFNNLLQVVSANLELMAARIDAADPPPAGWLRGRLLAAMDGVDRAARLTQHLLAFSRRQPLTPEPLDAARLLMGLEDMLRRALGPTVTVELAIAPGLWPLRADSQQLENALLNLAVNGRDAMAGVPSAQARLVIEARNATLDKAQCADDPELTPGQYVVISVVDRGCGMTAEQAARAVEPFYTTKPTGQGTGLGLSMAYGFARQSGGQLKLDSEPGRGTAVRLFIPRSPAPAPAPHVLPPRPLHGQGETVLLVEDDPAVRGAATLALRGLGYAVQEAVDADAAMAVLEAGLRPDLLFTDVMMPGTLDARSLARRALELRPGLAVVFTTGYSDKVLAGEAALNTQIHLVHKPWRIGDVAGTLRLALDQARRLAPARPMRVLLVEDDPLVRTVTAEMLADLGHEVLEAADADGALRLLPGVELLITDMELGEMDGLALAALARERMPGLPVIVASGQPRLHQSRDGRSEDGLLWLQKPYGSAALKDAVDRVGRGAPRHAPRQGVATLS